MTDPITTVTEPTPAQPAPVAPPVDVAALIQQFNQASDARVAGLMSAYDKKLNALQSELRSANRRASGMDDDEDPRIADLQQQLARAERDAAMARAAGKYPDAFPLFEQIVSQEDPEAQLAALDQWVKQQKAAATPAAPQEPAPATPEPAEPALPPVDPNNPLPTPAPIGGRDTFIINGKPVEMNDSLAARIIAQFRG